MTFSRNEILDIMKNEQYPLSSKYDPDWILHNVMGSHCLWLQESLTQEMNLKHGMRALDLGCGKAISSIFLAKEYGVKVWATDLWISSTDNWKRISETGMEDMVFPIHADAHELPFADGYFDVLMSVNSLFFYVTDGEFLREKILKHVKPGGEIGVIVPGFYREYTNGIPEDLKPHWSDQLDKWHTLKNEVCAKMGNHAWDILTDGISVPNIDNEFKCGCKTMREFMHRFDDMTDTAMAKAVLTRVRHGLKHSQFDWAREKFDKCGNNIDAFIKSNYKEDVETFTHLRDTGGDFYGQLITSEVFDFIFKAGILTDAARKGSEIHITAFP